MIEVTAVRGPLSDEHLEWVARLYGEVDEHYSSPDFLRHQFVENPFGWSVHVFVLADGAPVGHCAVVPFRARLGERPLVAGKIEAVVILKEYRRGGRLALDMLSRLYDFSHAQGIEVLFGLARPAVTRVFVRAGCTTTPVLEPTLVMLVRPALAGRGWPARRRFAALGVSVVQGAAAVCAGLLVRVLAGGRGGARMRLPGRDDATLVTTQTSAGSWTVMPIEAWEWYTGSGMLRVVETDGRFGARVLVRLVDGDPNGLQIVAWKPRREGILAGLLIVAALRKLARRHSLPTVRIQSWRPQEAALVRACRLLLFAGRGQTELLLHAETPELAEARVLVNPFFSVTF